MMLIGEYQHNLDAKGRVNFPAKLRENLGETFVITKGLDHSLFVYPREEWRKLEQRISELPVSKSRELQLFFFAGAAEVEPDKQGRVVIPANLREFAGLEKEVVIVGASVRAEIWDKDKWQATSAGITVESVAKAMDDLGF